MDTVNAVVMLFTTWSLFDYSIKTCFESNGQPSVSLWRLRNQDATKVSAIKFDKSVPDWMNVSVGWDQFPFKPNLSKKISGKIDGNISPICPDSRQGPPLPSCCPLVQLSWPAAALSWVTYKWKSREPGSQVKVGILFLSQQKNGLIIATFTRSCFSVRIKWKGTLMTATLKHCQRHNGPEGWVHITNLDQTPISESWLSINFKISTKHLDLT